MGLLECPTMLNIFTWVLGTEVRFTCPCRKCFTSLLPNPSIDFNNMTMRLRKLKWPGQVNRVCHNWVLDGSLWSFWPVPHSHLKVTGWLKNEMKVIRCEKSKTKDDMMCQPSRCCVQWHFPNSCHQQFLRTSHLPDSVMWPALLAEQLGHVAF